tara:strand:- start:70 stop:228 length:159 start_codon:yes stop_codon:yes gene_type:complete
MKKITPDYETNIFEYIKEKELNILLEYIELKYFEDHLASQIKKNFYNDRTTL